MACFMKQCKGNLCGVIAESSDKNFDYPCCSALEQNICSEMIEAERKTEAESDEWEDEEEDISHDPGGACFNNCDTCRASGSRE